jgi:hypothetical protein
MIGLLLDSLGQEDLDMTKLDGRFLHYCWFYVDLFMYLSYQSESHPNEPLN